MRNRICWAMLMVYCVLCSAEIVYTACKIEDLEERVEALEYEVKMAPLRGMSGTLGEKK